MSVDLTRDGEVGVITLNRPDKLNALSPDMRRQLAARAREAQDDRVIRTVVLTGAGRAFCAGGDIGAMSKRPDALATRSWIKLAHEATVALLALEKPLIAAINGVAAGVGFNLTLTADIILASSEARMIQSFAKVGLVPDGGGLWLLSRMVGLHKAKELFLMAATIDAAEAHRLGLVREVHPPEALLPAAMELAHRLAAGPTLAFGLGKALAHRAVSADLESYLALEAVGLSTVMNTEDHHEGVAAFLERRPAEFKGY
ncbi:MAG TPA: enoyl-CoA hydratase-related protein [Pseudonocardia sp.]|nr:enoyl-CoA hydratase-related protein [Pseudonocardia sp.]